MIKTIIQLRRDTLNNWKIKNPILDPGEIGLISISGDSYDKMVIGNGSANFNDLEKIPLNTNGTLGYGGLADNTVVPVTKQGIGAFWFVPSPGLYTNYGGIQVYPSEVAFLVWTGSTWKKESIKMPVDDILNASSENPVQNKVVFEKFEELEKAAKSSGNDILGKLNDEILNRTSADTDIKKLLDSETTNRTSADTSLSERIDNEISEREKSETSIKYSITNEISRAKSAEETLTTSISDETKRAQTAESSISKNLGDEVLRAKNEEHIISDSINTEISERKYDTSSLTTSINNEISRATTAESTLQSNITSEASTRETSDTTLQRNIDEEIQNRKTADTFIQKALTSETTRAEAAESTLTTNLGNETSTRATADTTLQGNIDKEVERAKTAESTLTSNLSNEISTRATADTTLQANIDKEIERAKTAESTLQTSLNKEISDRKTSDTILQGNIDKEETRAEKAEKTISDSLSSEISTRSATDTTLQGNIDTEIQDRKTAVSEVKTELTTEIQDRKTAVSNLTTSLATEKSDRENGDQSNYNLFKTHKDDTDNPHKVTKDQVGLGNVTNDAQVKRSEMGVAGGVATLDSSGFVSANQLPSYIDDVIEGYIFDGNKFYEDRDRTKYVEPSTNRIYVNLDDSNTYRWSGTKYVEISKSLALGETSTTAYSGDKGKKVRDDLDAEISRAGTSESTLQTNIDKEANTRKTADSTLQTNIDTLTERVESEGKVVSAAINDLNTRNKVEIQNRENAVSNVQTALDNEIGRAKTEEASITERLESEGKVVSAALNNLNERNLKEISDRTNSDTALQKNIDKEIERAKAEEAKKVNISDVSGTVTSGDTNPVNGGAVYTELAKIQNNLTIDSVVTSGSTNPVSSGAVSTAISGLNVSEIGESGKYIETIKEDAGKISGTTKSLPEYSLSIEPNTNDNKIDFTFKKNDTVKLTKTLDFSHTHKFADLSDKPTTIAGYGITDAYTKEVVDTKQDRIKKVEHGTSDTTITLTAGALHVWGSVGELNLTVPEETNSTYYSEYMFQFDSPSSGATKLSLSPSDELLWYNGVVPAVEAGKTYQGSIVNKVIILYGFKLE